MPRKGDPEMMPHMAGERVFLEDLHVGDVFDVWSKRSGGFFLQPDKMLLAVRSDGTLVASGGLILRTDANWGELRRK